MLESMGTYEIGKADILGVRLDTPGYDEAVRLITGWAKEGRQGYVCAADLKTVMQSYDSADLKKVVDGALLVTPDDLRLVWGLKLMGVKGASRVAAPRLALSLIGASAAAGVPIGFYGGSPEVLEKFIRDIRRRFPSIDVAFSLSPPDRPLLPHEDEAVMDWINASGARLLFVCIGGTREGQWMAEHAGRVGALMFGAGDAFHLAGEGRLRRPLTPSSLVQDLFSGKSPLPEYRRVLHHPRFMLLFSFQLLKRTLPVSRKILPL